MIPILGGDDQSDQRGAVEGGALVHRLDYSGTDLLAQPVHRYYLLPRNGEGAILIGEGNGGLAVAQVRDLEEDGLSGTGGHAELAAHALLRIEFRAAVEGGLDDGPGLADRGAGVAGDLLAALQEGKAPGRLIRHDRHLLSP